MTVTNSIFEKKTMKTILLFTLLSLSAISQEATHHFKATRNAITWEIAFETASISKEQIMDIIDKSHPKITINKQDFTGKATGINCTCPGGGFYFENNFNFIFTLYFQENKYKVVVEQIEFESESDVNSLTKFENFALIMGRNEFIKTKKNATNLSCMEKYFLKHFKIENAKETNWVE